MAASFIGGLFETVLGSFLKPLRKFFPSVVTGTVVLSIGLSLIAVGISSFGGGSSAKDYGSLENLFVGFVVLVVIVVLKHGTKGFTSFASILIGIIVGYVLVSIMAAVLPTTFTYVDDAGATVEASVVEDGKDKKVIVYKYKRKTGYHKKQGHRQPYTKVKIEKINA